MEGSGPAPVDFPDLSAASLLPDVSLDIPAPAAMDTSPAIIRKKRTRRDGIIGGDKTFRAMRFLLCFLNDDKSH
jgi:hypothetical protein